MSYDVFDLLTQEARLYPIRKPRKEGAAENKSRSRYFCSDWRVGDRATEKVSI